MKWIALSAALFSIGCAASGASDLQTREIVRIVKPDLPEYGAEFQERMADEIEALPEAECPRTGAMPSECSALLTFTLDAVRLRDQVGALR